MGWFVWLVIMIPVCLLLTGLGIFAFKREKPMWFWSGTEVKPEEIADVPAYNRANGIMWIVYSLVFWISTAAGLVNMKAGGIILIAGSVGGSILLMIAYHRILEKYRVKQRTDGQETDESHGKKTDPVDTQKAEQDFNATLELMKGICRTE